MPKNKNTTQTPAADAAIIPAADDAMTECEAVSSLLDSVKIDDAEPKLFIVSPDLPFVELPGGEYYPLRSRRIICWLTSLLWDKSARTALPKRSEVEQALNLLEARAWANQPPVEALVETELVKAVLAAVAQREEWVGSSTSLFIYFRNRVTQELWPQFPQTPGALGRELAKLAPVLRKEGFQVEQFRTKRARAWSIRRVTGDSRPAEVSPHEILRKPEPPKDKRQGDGSDSNPQLSEGANGPGAVVMLDEAQRQKLEQILNGGQP
jgi:hypothetical protein